jgi:hypothetical protein
MKEIKIEDKQKYLNENYPFGEVPKLIEKKHCIHCEETILVGEFKVLVDDDKFEYICCPNAPDCDGTIIDWMEL